MENPLPNLPPLAPSKCPAQNELGYVEEQEPLATGREPLPEFRHASTVDEPGYGALRTSARGHVCSGPHGDEPLSKDSSGLRGPAEARGGPPSLHRVFFN